MKFVDLYNKKNTKVCTYIRFKNFKIPLPTTYQKKVIQEKKVLLLSCQKVGGVSDPLETTVPPALDYQILNDLLSSGPDFKQSSLKHKVKKARISIFTVLSHFLWQIRPKYLIFTLFSIKYGNDYRIYLYAFSWSQLILDMLYKIS